MFVYKLVMERRSNKFAMGDVLNMFKKEKEKEAERGSSEREGGANPAYGQSEGL